MEQPKLFEDSLLDAIGTAIKAAGGFKHVAGKLWPARKPDTAYARLKACVDEKGEEELTPHEMLLIAKWARAEGDHSIMRYLGMELSYEVRAMDPEEEKTALQRSFVSGVKSLEAIAARMERSGWLESSTLGSNR